MLPLRDPPGVLGEIVARTVADLAARPLPTGPSPREEPVRDLVSALRAPGLSLIAELKPRSPSRGDLRPSVRPEEVAPAYRAAAAVSVLIDSPYFGGSLDLLRRMRALVDGPVLAKGFFVHPAQVFEAHAAGADAVLLMASVLPEESLRALLDVVRSLGMEALVEAHDSEEIEVALRCDAAVIGVNSRDLRSLSIDLDRGIALLSTVPADRVRVAESGLHSAADVDRVRPVADAALIGTAIMASGDPAAAIAALGFR